MRKEWERCALINPLLRSLAVYFFLLYSCAVALAGCSFVDIFRHSNNYDTSFFCLTSCNDSRQSGPFHYYFVIIFTYFSPCPMLLLLPYNLSITVVFYLTPHTSDPPLPLTGSFSYIIFAISFHCLSLHFPFPKIFFSARWPHLSSLLHYITLFHALFHLHAQPISVYLCSVALPPFLFCPS